MSLGTLFLLIKLTVENVHLFCSLNLCSYSLQTLEHEQHTPPVAAGGAQLHRWR